MLNNGNISTSFNSFEQLPLVPYKILEVLLNDKSQKVEDFWKLIYYPTIDALDKDNLTDEEKDETIWKGESLEQNFKIFMKPLIASSLESADAQTQMRIFRYGNLPIDRYESIVTIQIDLITNEKTSLVYYNGMLCERTDLMEAFILDILNGRDLGVGSGFLEYNREMSRSCQSLMSINNSKTMYGRAVILAIRYLGAESGGQCG